MPEVGSNNSRGRKLFLNGFTIFSWAIAVGSKEGLWSVVGTAKAIPVALWAITASTWTVTSSMWAIAGAT